MMEEHGRCRMGGKRGLALTAKYVWVPRLSVEYINAAKHKYFPETAEVHKKRRNQRRLLETCLISSEHTVHMLGKLTGKPNLHPCDSQAVSLWEWGTLSPWETMVFPICSHEMTRLFWIRIPSLSKNFKIQGHFSDSEHIFSYQDLTLNGPSFTTHSSCSENFNSGIF